MKRVLTGLWVLIVSVVGEAQIMQPIGQWRAHVPFGHGIQVDVSGGEIIYASKYGICTFDPLQKEYSIKTKGQGLSDLPIQFIKKDPVSSQLLVVYENGNMDLLHGDQTSNLPDLYLKQTTSIKRIYDAVWIGNEIYLATSLGVVVVNASRNEIKDTYKVLANNVPLPVMSVAMNNGFLYATTSQGMQKVVFNVQSMSDPKQWLVESQMTGTQLAPKQLLAWNTDLIAWRNDSLFIKNASTWSFLYASSSSITSIRVSNNKLLVTSPNKLIAFASGSTISQMVYTPATSLPVDAIDLNGSYWIADQNKGLVQITNGVEKIQNPDAPLGVPMGQSVFQNGRLLGSSGGVSANGIPLNNSDGFSVFDGNAWKNYSSQQIQLSPLFTDIVSVASDPVSGKIFVGSYGKGLATLASDGKISVYASNSFLTPALNNNTSFNVTGLAFDELQQLWALCDGAAQGLCVLKKDGSFKRFTIPFSYSDFRVSKLLIGASKKIWIVSANGNGVICFDYGGTIDQVNDDQWRFFRAGSGNGNLPSANVNCIAEDRNGFIWVGTDKGIGIIQCGENVFSSTCQTTIPIVQQDTYAGPLFGEENVLDIEVDGANRKWVATEHGVWLISADGQKVIHRFRSDNSPLLSDWVYDIAINPTSGEVFFMTSMGICSFRGTATAPVFTKQHPIVFPNPVPSGYGGSIAIKDLPENAWVRITELDGKMVYQTRSLGGQAIWNGKNYKGEKISSGVYLVMVSDELNTYQVATKIFFIK